MRYIILIILLLNILYADALYNRGEYLYFSKACSSCHGPSAEGSSSTPKLARKSQKYLSKKLNDFKNGKFFNQTQEMMSQFAQALQSDDIEALSYFLATHKDEEVLEIDDNLLGGFGS